MPKITMRLVLELRGQRQNTEKHFEVEVDGPEDATLESLRPWVLEKTVTTEWGATRKTTHLDLQQYDPRERQALGRYSIQKSKGSDFIWELEQGHGFKEVKP